MRISTISKLLIYIYICEIAFDVSFLWTFLHLLIYLCAYSRVVLSKLAPLWYHMRHTASELSFFARAATTQCFFTMAWRETFDIQDRHVQAKRKYIYIYTVFHAVICTCDHCCRCRLRRFRVSMLFLGQMHELLHRNRRRSFSRWYDIAPVAHHGGKRWWWWWWCSAFTSRGFRGRTGHVINLGFFTLMRMNGRCRGRRWWWGG